MGCHPLHPHQEGWGGTPFTPTRMTTPPSRHAPACRHLIAQLGHPFLRSGRWPLFPTPTPPECTPKCGDVSTSLHAYILYAGFGLPIRASRLCLWSSAPSWYRILHQIVLCWSFLLYGTNLEAGLSRWCGGGLVGGPTAFAGSTTASH